jgi:hypothetical protein
MLEQKSIDMEEIAEKAQRVFLSQRYSKFIDFIKLPRVVSIFF